MPIIKNLQQKIKETVVQYNQENEKVKKISNWQNIMPMATVSVEKGCVKWNWRKLPNIH